MLPTLSPLIPLILLILFNHSISSSELTDVQTKPFQFLEALRGSQKGNNVLGLGKLKIYLKKLGYLNYPNSPQNSNLVEDNEFDEYLERAIKTYQLNYNLASTGSLDSATVAQMMMPRCGVPDIRNRTNWMSSSQEKNHSHGSSPLHIVSRYALYEGRLRWPASKLHLTYGFLSQTDQLGPPLTRAFQKWASVTQFTFEQISDYDDADVKISFQFRDHGDGQAFDGPHGILAHAFAPTAGKLHLDGEDLWATGPTPGAYDLETVGLHEIGHVLGLDHSKVEEAIMYPILPFGAAKGLNEDDITGIRELYSS